MNRFIDVKPSKCIGCRTCEIACVLAHAELGAALAMPTNDQQSGDVLASLGQMPRLKVIKGENVCMPVTCHHCDDAPCAGACPTGAISFVQDTVQVNESRCIGCKSCMIACPYGMIDVVAVAAVRPFAGVRLSMGTKAQAHKCDLCIDRAGGPACVAACPTHALLVADPGKIYGGMHLRQKESVREALSNEANP